MKKDGSVRVAISCTCLLTKGIDKLHEQGIKGEWANLAFVGTLDSGFLSDPVGPYLALRRHLSELADAFLLVSGR